MRKNIPESDFRDALKKYWGYEDFRPHQLEVLKSVSNGIDTLVLLPTGGGKSILYQLPGLLSEGVCIVVTPLIALMKDQVDRLRKMGIPATSIHGGLTQRQIDIILDNACWGDLKFLYVAPERLSSRTFRDRLNGMNVSLLAVDEAHCISQWGYDFRPAYLRISEIRERIPETPVLALTASATPTVTQDILNRLKMLKGRVITGEFTRANLSYAVRQTDDKKNQLLRIINNVDGSAIVYVRTRDNAKNIAELLISEGHVADFYHGGLPATERSGKQEQWTKDQTRIMVCTNAFGMGIDKPDVRLVVHYDTPDSLEAYYQEAGRAGRDGRRAFAVLLAGSDEHSSAIRRFNNEYPGLEKVRECYDAIHNYFQIGYGEGKYASLPFDIYDFCAKAKIFTATAYNSFKILQQNGYLTLTDECDNPPRIMFTVGRDDLYKLRIEREELDHILRTILRLYEGVFSGRLIGIDIQELAHASGYTPDKVKELLKKLWMLRVIKYIPANRSPIIAFHEERVPSADLYISPETYSIRKKMAAERIEGMNSYVSNTTECRNIVMQEYFGIPIKSKCGVCDVCLQKKKKRREGNGIAPVTTTESLSTKIYALLKLRPCDIKELVGNFPIDPEEIIEAVDKMIAEGAVCYGSGGKLYIK